MANRTQIPYRIETPRLHIRCWSPLDAPKLRALIDASDHHLRPYIPWMKDEPMSLAQTAQKLRVYRARFDRDEDYRYAIFIGGDRTLVGETGLYARVGSGGLEIGYVIGIGHTRQGYATEAAQAMVRIAFEIHKIDRVELHCDPGNEPSMRIAKTLGFEHEATLKRRFFDAGDEPVDTAMWSLFAADYRRSSSSSLTIRAYDCMDNPLL